MRMGQGKSLLATNEIKQGAGALGLFPSLFSHWGVCPKGWLVCWLRPWVMESDLG